jgi:phosphatidylserine/phosphatidylglycerophosphate/cardiolipin synthase-like enzyme
VDEVCQALGISAPGRNCWRVECAERASVLVDAAAYYRRLAQAIRKARRSIVILGWGFDASIRLCPEDSEQTLGDLLRECVERHPGLEVRVLIWSFAVVHAPGAPMPLLLGSNWDDHPRIQLRLDADHPIYAAHHQKIVCIDDCVAFAGGMDLTLMRWDTCEHRVNHPIRQCPDGSHYGPVHDIQMVIAGEAARSLAEIARARWLAATGGDLPAIDRAGDCWPDGLRPDFIDTRIAIARTAPAFGGRPGAQEAIRLTLDALSSARRRLYIEAQYLTAPSIGRVLASRLREEHGPEIMIVVTRSSRSRLERFVMGQNRDRLLRKLMQADRHGRLRVLYPVHRDRHGGGEREILVHSKLIIADDVFLRVGSSNLNNRSIGLDSECDLAIDVRTPSERAAIATIMYRLIGEHLGVSPESISKACRSQRSLIDVVDRFSDSPRELRPLDVKLNGPTRPVFGTGLLDPVRPFEPDWLLRRKPRHPARHGTRPVSQR